MSFSGSGVQGKNGEDWTYKIFFVPEADDDAGPIYKIPDQKLRDKLSSLVDVDEKIEEVTIYQHPLNKIVPYFLYHNFVLFKTHGWWWTIEKNSEGITIQRSKLNEAVRENYRQEKRIAIISEVIRDSGRKSVGDLIRWLYENNELNKKYSYLNSNCQHFAKKTFNYVAEHKKYEIRGWW